MFGAEHCICYKCLMNGVKHMNQKVALHEPFDEPANKFNVVGLRLSKFQTFTLEAKFSYFLLIF